MLRFLAKIALRSRIRHDNHTRKAAFLPWEKIESIALILCSRDNVNKSLIDSLIAQTGKYVEVFYLQLESKVPAFHDWHCFTRQERSLLRLPLRQTEKRFESRSFDLVINTCQEIEPFSVWLTSALKAPLKCGSTSKYHEVDLVIRKKGITSLVDYLNQVLRYLKMIRTE